MPKGYASLISPIAVHDLSWIWMRFLRLAEYAALFRPTSDRMSVKKDAGLSTLSRGGETYFITVNLLERYPNDLLVRHIKLFRSAVRKVREKRPSHIDAWVILPDHLHCVWTLPEGGADLSGRLRNCIYG